MMSSSATLRKDNPLHIFFLPLLAPGHMLPMVDMVRFFSDHGVKCTIVTTPANAARIHHSLDRTNAAAAAGGVHPIQLLRIQFSSSTAGLPDGCDNLTDYRTPEVTQGFFDALTLMRRPFEDLLAEHRPDCIISDCFYAWTADVAVDFGIPRLVFHGTSSFSLAVSGNVRLNNPHVGLSSDAEAFVLPDIPHRVEITRSELPEFIINPPEYIKDMGLSHLKSYGVVVNSFYDLEPEYAANRVAGLKTWHIGPLSLCNRDAADRAVRGGKATAGVVDGCLKWLDSNERGSVLYVCFGSLCRFTRAQLHEIASGLEASGHPFLWVVRDAGISDGKSLPEGFEERTSGKGLILRGWAPQILILNHEAIGGFMTHCGWNSSLEGISAGVPLITWPLFAEQFLNEKLIVQVLKVGVSVGAELCSNNEEERPLVERQRVEGEVARLMGGGVEAEDRRRRAKQLRELARTAVEEGGSSYNSMTSLIEELIDVKNYFFNKLSE